MDQSAAPFAPTPQLRAWRAFLEAHARITEVLARELRDEEDLPLTWYDVLVHLSEAPEHRLRMQELAGAVLLSKSGLSRLIDRMQRAGLVDRERCPSDGRGTFARLTDAGLAALVQAAPSHARGVAEHFSSHLSDAEAAALELLMRRLANDGADAPESHPKG